MGSKNRYIDPCASRENFLYSLLNKIIKEYKALLEYTRRTKPLKIIEILSLSSVPGETIFSIQITNKNSIAHLSASQIIKDNYNLNDFNDFHAEMISQAALGKLIEFLKLTESEPEYKIISKRFDVALKQFIFTLEDKNNVRFNNTADELSNNKSLLSCIDIQDIYDIGYTQGAESIIKEKTAILLAKNKK